MEETLSKANEYLVTYGLQLVAAVAIFVIGKWLAGVTSRAIEKAMVNAKVDQTLAIFVKNLSYFALLAFVVLAALGKLEIQTASFVAILGAAGLAIGFALQGSLSNFAAGVMIILFRPFKAGDFIEAGGTIGSVQEIQIFNTILNHPDNRKQIVPNSQVLSGIVTNFTAIEKRRVDLVFGISYEDDLLKAKKILEGIVNDFPGVLKDPAPLVAVSELGASSVDFVARPWVKPADYWAVRFGLTEKVKLEFDKNGITIPYPQRTVHVQGSTVTETTAKAPSGNLAGTSA
jgi:small conductance mechanosensitive channel